MDERDDSHKMITLSLDELDTHIQHDLAEQHKLARKNETTKEKVEGYIYLACLIVGAVLLIVHAFTDWIPFLVGLPSARVILTRWI
jgi:hypothetical protein